MPKSQTLPEDHQQEELVSEKKIEPESLNDIRDEVKRKLNIQEEPKIKEKVEEKKEEIKDADQDPTDKLKKYLINRKR